MYGDWLLLRRPQLRGRLAFDIRFEMLQKRQLRRLQEIRWRVDGWRQSVKPYGLFVLKKGQDTKLSRALLRQRGARLEFRGADAIVVSVPRSRAAT
jgi:hypothetical protein